MAKKMTSKLPMQEILGVIAGGSIAQVLPTKVLKGLAALGFALLAVKLLWPSDGEY